ncbi:MAG: uncharacterized protein QOH57_4572 [Mycobacterium sp.]|jgi:uncharacterized protein YggE|nr:uncharacterized protein [Mycobacterium sp.]
MKRGAATTMLRKGIVLVAATVTAAGLSGCDITSSSADGTGPDNRQVTVVGSGRVQGTPDTLTASVSIEANAADVTTAMNQTSVRTKAVIDALVNEAKIDRKDISTSSVSLQPRSSPDGATIIGYSASNSVSVKIRQLDSASKTLALIVEKGQNATRINSVNYSIDDDSQLVKDARARAFEDAKARAAQYADLSGLRLGTVISISESSGSTPPMPYSPAPKAEAAPVPLEPGQQTVSFSVTAIWELR